MRPNSLRLTYNHKCWFYGTFGLLFLSGVLWLVFHYFVRIPGEFGETAHPAQAWFLKAHGGAAMGSLILLGTLVPGHIRRGWNARKNRTTGGSFLVLNGILILSGYALYYFGGEHSRAFISALHWIIGLAFPAVLIWHIWHGRRLRKIKK